MNWKDKDKWWRFDLSNIKGDLFGGLTAGIVAIPLVLAFGDQSGLGAIAGIYGAIGLSILGSLFGGVPTHINGPTAPMTVVTVIIVSTIQARYPGVDGGISLNGLAIIFFIFALSGILQILFGILKIGTFIKYIPYPVISGFMSGIGLLIILQQLHPIAGLNAHHFTWDIVEGLPEIVTGFSLKSFVIATSTIVIIYLIQKFNKKISGPLIGLIIMTSIVVLFKLDLTTLAEIPQTIPKIRTDAFSILSFTREEFFNIILLNALTLATLGAIDTLLTALIADKLTKTRHESNKELVGQGIGNFFVGLIGGIPGAGASIRTVVNIRSGGKTRLSGIFSGLFLLGVLLGLGSLVAYIPKSVLAGILITVGVAIIDKKAFRRFKRIPKADAIVMIIVMLMTIFVGLLQAVLVGVFLSLFLILRKVDNMSVKDVFNGGKSSVRLKQFWIKDKNQIKIYNESVYIKKLYGPIYFGMTSYFQQLIREIPDTKYLVIKMEKVPYIDQSGLNVFKDLIKEMKRRNIVVLITNLRNQPKQQLMKFRIIDKRIPTSHLFDNMDQCVGYLKAKLFEDKED